MRSLATAKHGGDISILFPDGCNIQTVPADLMVAIDHGLIVLSWKENLPEDEMPPQWMWSLDWELEEHFRLVKLRRDLKSRGSSSIDADSYSGERADLVDFDENVYAARLRQG